MTNIQRNVSGYAFTVKNVPESVADFDSRGQEGNCLTSAINFTLNRKIHPEAARQLVKLVELETGTPIGNMTPDKYLKSMVSMGAVSKDRVQALANSIDVTWEPYLPGDSRPAVRRKTPPLNIAEQYKQAARRILNNPAQREAALTLLPYASENEEHNLLWLAAHLRTKALEAHKEALSLE